MTQLTNEQIKEGMSKITADFLDDSPWEVTERLIRYLTSIGYQITKIEPDEEMLLAGMNATNHPPCPLKTPDLKPREGQCELQILRDLRCNQYKAMSAVSRIKVE